MRVSCDSSSGWHAAKDACEADKAWLAIIRDDDSNAQISQLYLGGAWIGATDEVVEGTWIDSLGQPLTYFNWWTNGVSSEPDNSGNQDCVFVNFLSPHAWGDIQCDWDIPCYICQKGLHSNTGECASGNHGCDTNASCTEINVTSYTCECNPGYTGDGYTCNEDAGCDEGWHEIDNECIQVTCESPGSWHEAQEKCMAKNAHLATIRSEAGNMQVNYNYMITLTYTNHII